MNILGPLAVLLKTICSNQDIVKSLFVRNPEEFRHVAATIALLDLPEDFKADSFDLSYLCENRGESGKLQNSLEVRPNVGLTSYSNILLGKILLFIYDSYLKSYIQLVKRKINWPLLNQK